MESILVFGIIGKDVRAVDIAKKLARVTSDAVDVKIHSQGGSVVEGKAIYNILKDSGKEIHTTVIGDCASIATYPALAAKVEHRKMYKGQKWFVHNPWTRMDGNADELSAQIPHLRKAEEEMAEFYARHTNLDSFTLRGMMSQNTSMTAEEALAAGFIGEVLDPVLACAYLPENQELNTDNIMSKIQSIKDAILSFLKPGKTEKPEEQEINAWELALEDGQTLVALNPQDTNQPSIGDLVKIKGNAEAIQDSEYVVASTRQMVVVEDGKISDLRNHVEDVNAEVGEVLTVFARATGERLAQTDASIEELKALITKQNESLQAHIDATNASIEASEKGFGEEREALKAEIADLKSLIKSDYTPPASSEVGATPGSNGYKQSAIERKMAEIRNEKNA